MVTKYQKTWFKRYLKQYFSALKLLIIIHNFLALFIFRYNNSFLKNTSKLSVNVLLINSRDQKFYQNLFCFL